MVDSNPKDTKSTEDILASIRKTMLEEPGEHLPDPHSSGEHHITVSPSEKMLVGELRQLIDEYTDLPEDLVTAVSQLELEARNSTEEIGNDPLIELEELSENADSNGDRAGTASGSSLPSGFKDFLDETAADMSIPAALRNSGLDAALAILLKIVAYRWLDQNMEPLVRKLVRSEIERLAKTL